MKLEHLGHFLRHADAIDRVAIEIGYVGDSSVNEIESFSSCSQQCHVEAISDIAGQEILV